MVKEKTSKIPNLDLSLFFSIIKIGMETEGHYCLGVK